MCSISKELDEAAFVDEATLDPNLFPDHLSHCQIRLGRHRHPCLSEPLELLLVPLVLITNDNLKMITQGLEKLRGHHGQDEGLVTAGVVLFFVPVVILYIIFQEQMILGLTAGAFKG